jgi:hypothetical protein
VTKDEALTGAQIERSKLDDLARRINDASRNAALDLAYAVGGLVIRELYDGSLAMWGRQGTRRRSYQDLAARGDLLLSPTALCRAVGVYVLCERHGGKKSWPSLSVSHLQEVLTLESPAQERLLGMAEVERWSVSRLRSEIAKQRPKPTRGRPRSTKKSVRDLLAFIAARRESLSEPKNLDRLDARTVDELRRTLALLQQDLERLEQALAKTKPRDPVVRAC